LVGLGTSGVTSVTGGGDVVLPSGWGMMESADRRRTDVERSVPG
jgi:hypothetical protein